MEKFNVNLKQFINVLKKKYPEQKDNIENYYNFDNPGNKYVDEFLENCKNCGDDISSKNEIIFSKGSKILNHIDFYSIWNNANDNSNESKELNEEQRENIWKYLHTLYIFAYEYRCEKDFKLIMNEIKSKDVSTLDEEGKTFRNIIEGLSIQNRKPTEDELESEDCEKKTDKPSIPVPDLFNGVIGNLAKEIAEEIDPSKINIEDPSKLLSSLMNGNLDESSDDSGIFDLVKDITGKIQNKLSSGNLNEEQLFSEAQNMMKSFAGGQSGIPGMDKNFNPMNMFNNIMKSGMMDDLDPENKNIVDEASNIIKNKGMSGTTSNQLSNKAQLKSTRDRLRSKLEKKKKLLEEKQNKKKEKETVQNHEDIDLDALANEIEGM
tara:strand:- start:1646 stop:2779 length:1134 start_codon:yes stop_codon:yes gene_type:complete